MNTSRSLGAMVGLCLTCFTAWGIWMVTSGPSARFATPPSSTLAARAQAIMPTGTADGDGPAAFTLTSPAIDTDGRLPADYTCDGASATLPLTWSGAPAETQSFAIIMHHIASPTDIHWYWVLYNLPPELSALERNATGLGTLGNNSVDHRQAYAPPCSKGPGDKVYIYTVYALSAYPQLTVSDGQVTRQVLLDAIEPIVLASAELRVIYARSIR